MLNAALDLNASAPSSVIRPLPSRKGDTLPPTSSVAPRNPESERELVLRLLSSEAKAWQEFSRSYSRVILGSIRRVLTRFAKVTGEADVEEIYARFCLELLGSDMKKLRCFDETKGAKLSTWLSMLAQNCAYDHLRKLRRERRAEPLPEYDFIEAEDPSPYEEVVKGQQAKLAARLLDGLSERDREFVELYFAEGLSPEEISERMGIHVKTVYTKKHKITARLEALLAGSLAA